MLEHDLVLTLRNILKYKTYAVINPLGLAIGMASAVLIGLYVLNEFRVDRFHRQTGHIHV